MTNDRLIRIACLTALALPQLIAATQGLTVSPTGMLMIAVLNFAAGLVLSELESSGVVVKTQDDLEPLNDEDVQQISDELEKRLKKKKVPAPK